MEITESHQHKYFNFQLEQQLKEVFLFYFDDPIADYLEIMSSLNIKIFLSGEGQFVIFFNCISACYGFLYFWGQNQA
jgi:hypothetical protein